MKKTISIIISILIILGIMVVGLISILDDEKRISGDSLKFKEEYELLNGKYFEEEDIIASTMEIEKDNPYIYVNDFDVLDKLTKGTHIIYFGNPECGWSRRVVPVLTTFANKNKIETIYYYNFSNLEKLINEANNEEKEQLYNSIINIVKDYTTNIDETGSPKLLTPIVFFLKDGNIVGSHYKLVDSYLDYNADLTNEQTEELVGIYQTNYDKMFANICEEDC